MGTVYSSADDGNGGANYTGSLLEPSTDSNADDGYVTLTPLRYNDQADCKRFARLSVAGSNASNASSLARAPSKSSARRCVASSSASRICASRSRAMRSVA